MGRSLPLRCIFFHNDRKVLQTT
ncbi:hypothetical protein E2C01_075014 [Portunus trituberculatus]|uniref:Uncharacterized protein n=1 Tax=Portunus trituberculatus TaxID=210409 RepID=A0A5B7IIS0_PORTR|nr:hypothetical protein [Portunus trituberculatus]